VITAVPYVLRKRSNVPLRKLPGDLAASSREYINLSTVILRSEDAKLRLSRHGMPRSSRISWLISAMIYWDYGADGRYPTGIFSFRQEMWRN